MKPSKLGTFQFVSSSLWITVLVVRVGCIIEAHPSPTNSNGNYESGRDAYQKPSKTYGTDTDQYGIHQQTELETAASHSILTSPRNGLFSRINKDGNGGIGEVSDSISKKESSSFQGSHEGKSLSISLTSSNNKKNNLRKIVETATFPLILSSTTSSSTSATAAHSKEETEHEASPVVSTSEKGSDGDSVINRDSSGTEEADSCSGKIDGYYITPGSQCSSYHFCAFGKKLSFYVCPIGTKFNGKRCESDYKCPTDTEDGGHLIINECEKKSNGYYPKQSISSIDVGKYFYCFQQAKVVELQCDPGKAFVNGKCVFLNKDDAFSHKRKGNPITVDRDMDTSCSGKSNGFYQDLLSNCEKYYFCIGEQKTELRCKDNYVFNQDIGICVHHSRYECPSSVEFGTSDVIIRKLAKEENISQNDYSNKENRTT